MTTAPIVQGTPTQVGHLEQRGPLMEGPNVQMVASFRELTSSVDGGVLTRTLPTDNTITSRYTERGTDYLAAVTTVPLDYPGVWGIACAFCGNSDTVVWCRHIHHLVREGHDRHLLMAAISHSPNDEVLVPLVPTEGVYLPISARVVRPGYRALCLSMTNRKAEEWRGMIGVVKEHEFGLTDCLSMVVDYFYGHFEDHERFHQGIPKNGDGISEFSHELYCRVFGKSFGALTSYSAQQAAEDAPQF